MPTPPLPDVLERLYENQLALEAAIMELSLWVAEQGGTQADENVRGSPETIGENAGYIRQGLAQLKALDRN